MKKTYSPNGPASVLDALFSGKLNITVPTSHPPEPTKLTEEQKKAAIAAGFTLTGEGK